MQPERDQIRLKTSMAMQNLNHGKDLSTLSTD